MAFAPTVEMLLPEMNMERLPIETQAKRIVESGMLSKSLV